MPGDRPRLVLIGDLGVDLVIGPLERWPVPGTETVFDRHEMRVGGSAGNAALAAAHLGGEVKLISSIGNDALAQWARTQVAGIDAALHVCAASTSLSVGLLHPWNERTFLTTRGHLDDTGFDDLRSLIPAANRRSIALLTGVFLMPKLRRDYSGLIRHLRMLGHEIAIDSGWPGTGWTPAVRAEFADWLAECDHLLLNEKETCGLAGCDDIETALRRLAACAAPTATIVAKGGSQGAKAAFQGRIISYATQALEVFDTVGAGDAFNAGYLLACAGATAKVDQLAAGCRAAARIISNFPRGKLLRQSALEQP